MRSLNRLPQILLVIAVVTAAISWAAPKGSWDSDAQKRHAEYLFLESQAAYNAGEFDRYLTLLERAHSLDSTDIDIAGEWALMVLMDRNADSASVENAYQLLGKRFMAYPENFQSGVIYANVAQQQRRYGDALKIWEKLDSIYPTRPQIAQELARAYLRASVMGDSTAFDKAMSIYDRIQEGSGRSIDLSTQKINAYYLKGDTLAVLNELDSLVAHAPNDCYTAMFVGANYQYLNYDDLAIKYFDRACELDSTFGPAFLQRARFYNAKGDSVAFDREVFHALESPNLDVPSKIDILRSYVSELYTDSAQEPRIRQLFDNLQKMHAGESEIHSLYGAYLYEREDYNGATEQLSYTVALEPAEESNWTSYIQMAAMAQDTTAIIQGASQAMQRFPENLYFPVMISNVYRINGNLEAALAVLDSVKIDAIYNERAVGSFLTNKGDLYTVMGDTIKALEVYDEAIQVYPNNSMALNNAAYFIALTDGDLDKAERYSARSLQGDELNPTYLDTYAWIFFKKKDYKMAKHYIDIALNSYKEAVLVTDPDNQDNVEESLSPTPQEGELNEVVEIVEVVEDGEGLIPSADIYDHAGDIYFMNGEVDKAITFWEKAHELATEDALIEKKVTHKTIFMK